MNVLDVMGSYINLHVWLNLYRNLHWVVEHVQTTTLDGSICTENRIDMSGRIHIANDIGGWICIVNYMGGWICIENYLYMGAWLNLCIRLHRWLRSYRNLHWVAELVQKTTWLHGWTCTEKYKGGWKQCWVLHWKSRLNVVIILPTYILCLMSAVFSSITVSAWSYFYRISRKDSNAYYPLN